MKMLTKENPVDIGSLTYEDSDVSDLKPLYVTTKKKRAQCTLDTQVS